MSSLLDITAQHGPVAFAEELREAKLAYRARLALELLRSIAEDARDYPGEVALKAELAAHGALTLFASLKPAWPEPEPESESEPEPEPGAGGGTDQLAFEEQPTLVRRGLHLCEAGPAAPEAL